MPAQPKAFRAFPHDWFSTDYVSDWITHDVARDSERRPLLQQMLSSAPFTHDAALKVLDVGAGYGVVTEEVLKTFPAARITLQDYSQPMLDQARQRLAKHSDRRAGSISGGQRKQSGSTWNGITKISTPRQTYLDPHPLFRTRSAVPPLARLVR